MHPLPARRRPHPGGVRHGRSRRGPPLRRRGPGAEEDRQGLPFVGRRASCSTGCWLEELGITRDACYIANVVKCRPPEQPRSASPTRSPPAAPGSSSSSTSSGPRSSSRSGNFAAQLLLETTEGITKLRGRSYPFRDGVLDPDACTRPPPCAAAASRSRRCGPTSCGPSTRWPRRRRRDRTRSGPTRSDADTAAVGARRRRARPPRRPHPARRASWVPARPRSPRASARPRASTEPDHQPTFTLVHHVRRAACRSTTSTSTASSS